MSPTAETATGFPPTFYKLDPGRFAEYRRELVIRLSVVGTVILLGPLYLAWHFGRERSPFSLVFIPVLIAWLFYRQFKDERNKWQSLVLEFRDGKLLQRLDNYPVVELVPNEVKKILESPRGIIIVTNNRLKRLILSNRLSNYDAFRTQLISWAPAVKAAVWHRFSWDYILNFCGVLASLCVFGGPLYLMYTSRHAVILPLGIALSLSMLAMILYVRNSPSIPTRERKRLWFLVLLPIFAMLVRLL